MAAYLGDEHLGELLAAAGARTDVAAVRALVRGVAAAPRGHDPDAWLRLIVPEPPAELAAQLRALRDSLPETPAPPPAERLALLRRELAGRGLSGMVLPLTDQHRGEYVPANAMRLAWLTGFTGSAGSVVVLKERAALFVDGRYTLQAEQQVEHALYERAQVPENPPHRWLAEHLTAGERVGFDPMLHGEAEVKRLRAACAKADGELVALDGNPVDAVWAGRPPDPIAPVVRLDEAYAGEASADKRGRLGEEVAKAGAEVAVLTAPDSIMWLLNLRGGDVPFNPLAICYAALHADGHVTLWLDRRKLPADLALDNGVTLEPYDAFANGLAELGRAGRRVLLGNGAPFGVGERLREAGARVIAGADPCALAKACKNATELDGARAAQRRDGAAVCRFLHWLDEQARRRPVDEIEAAARLDGERAKDPLFRGLSFDTISAVGPNAALPHYRVSEAANRATEPGTLYLVDSGGQYLDGTTDITRTVAIGEPSAEMRARFTLVLVGHVALATAVFPAGTTGAQLDAFARAPLWRAGLDFDHGTGHGVGSYLCVHEGPAGFSKRYTEAALKPGMILSNEPAYYKSGDYGIRTENLVAVVAAGRPAGGERELLAFETLTRAPIDRRLLDRDLLDGATRDWLDSYHAKVYGDLAPLLDEPVRAWLAAATAPVG